MNASVFKFSYQLVLVLGIVFGLHILALKTTQLPLFENKILLAYTVNAILAISIFGFLKIMNKKHSSQIGFLFIAGSLLKFVVFFIVFYGPYKADGSMSKLEFAAFFVPYLICLIFETFSLSKWLNKME